jgi:ABC-type multidrug transport system fused ATPase/permease subunit
MSAHSEIAIEMGDQSGGQKMKMNNENGKVNSVFAGTGLNQMNNDENGVKKKVNFDGENDKLLNGNEVNEDDENRESGQKFGLAKAVSISNLYYSYGKEKVLRGLDMNVNAGTIYGLLGASGCGKYRLLSY